MARADWEFFPPDHQGWADQNPRHHRKDHLQFGYGPVAKVRLFVAHPNCMNNKNPNSAIANRLYIAVGYKRSYPRPVYSIVFYMQDQQDY